ELSSPPLGILEPFDCREGVAIPARYQPEDSQVLRRMETELVLRQVEGSLRLLARDPKLAAMHGYDSDREVVLWHFHPVLDGDVVRASGVPGRELPSPGPELDPGKAPECAGAPRLVPFAPLVVLAFEQRTSLIPLRGR